MPLSIRRILCDPKPRRQIHIGGALITVSQHPTSANRVQIIVDKPAREPATLTLETPDGPAVVHIVQERPGRFKLAIQAPREVSVLRGELTAKRPPEVQP